MPWDGLTVIEHRLLIIFALAFTLWVLEPIPIYATSLLIILLECLLLSNKALWFLRAPEDAPGSLGVVMQYDQILGTLASPVIILFLGGFFLAMAATKYHLDRNLARVLLSRFGTKASGVMLGLMVITAVFSMFMSNTATTAMMLAVLLPVLKSLDPDDRARTGMVLSIPFAANLGGIGTPIGTPPNAVGMKYLVGENATGFGEWMAFAVPFSLVLLLLAWLLLCWMFPAKGRPVEVAMEGRFVRSREAWIVYAVSVLTVVLWMLGDLHGMSPHVVAMIPVTIFSALRITTTDDLKKISWDVLWLVAGGIALGLAMEETGLSKRIVEGLPFGTLSPLAVLGAACGVAMAMSTFMSNTATANLLLPLMAALGGSMISLTGIGGSRGLIIGVTLATSMAMAMPISTPPNALAHATGMVSTQAMMRAGLIISVSGTGMVIALVLILHKIGWC